MIFLLISGYYLNNNHIVAYVNQGPEVRDQRTGVKLQGPRIRGLKGQGKRENKLKAEC